MSFLGFVGRDELPGCDEPIHDRPLGDWRTVNTRASCYWNTGVLENRGMHKVIQAGRGGLDDFDTDGFFQLV